jgi:putative transposase
MKKYKTYYKRNLPHYQPLGYAFFVTYRLNGSLPVQIIKRLKQERESELKVIEGFTDKTKRFEQYRKYQSVYFGKFDKLLDGFDHGPTWLKEDKVAQIVKDAIHFYDKMTYDLICYTIMYNHVHQVFIPIVGRDLSRPENQNVLDMNVKLQFPIVTDILRLIKGATARECNKLLNRAGAFWQHESYDHVVRDYNELLRIVEYVINNPVKASLCEKWEDWKWSYCNTDYL